MNETIAHLNRSSTPAAALAEPAPDDAQLRQILEVALTAPDHGRLRPYRFITIRGEARYKLSDLFGRAVQQREPDVDAAYLQKQQDKPLRSPLIVVVVASLVDSPKVPEIEQMLSAGAAAHNILLASKALGFGSIWLTGANAYDPFVCDELGLAENERIIGFVYLGTPTLEIPARELPDAVDFLTKWE
ncbi:MAG: nitroreductase [Gammaproteobacteria bacterium]|nr:nitroreductase [Gammaproteobacteria bacterium]MDH3859100.1 nitroreductase [Gammaproteobacteria bacterium]